MQVKLELEEVQEPTIKNLTFKMKRGDMMLVAGRVGTGKTTLLHALMREIKTVSGKASIKGSIAYVEQEPFIFSASVKENVAFGLEFDQARFDYAVKVSQLEEDVKNNFSNGADTIIGERGINVSGGQKARISLARAVYMDADIFLLDDPLSAVDPAVANAIFDKCIKGALKNKIVVLVTHQLQFMRKSDRNLIIKGDSNHLIGDYNSIVTQGYDAEEILNAFNKNLNVVE